MAIGRRPRRSFNERALEEPSPWRKVLYVVIAAGLPIMVWEKRGAVFGVVAVVTYGGLFLIAALNHRGMVAWSQRHAVLDCLVLIPLAFLALGYLTPLPAWACLLGALAAFAAALALRRRRGGA